MLFVAAEDGRCGGHAFIWWCRLASSACGGVQDATVAMAASIREAADSLMRAAASGERPRHTCSRGTYRKRQLELASPNSLTRKWKAGAGEAPNTGALFCWLIHET